MSRELQSMSTEPKLAFTYATLTGCTAVVPVAVVVVVAVTRFTTIEYLSFWGPPILTFGATGRSGQ